ncbi:50S ribosomal protein L9 [Clostridia bacterium OttesenSCG-928-F22]|nr:50S ribosomal protein L9 [Clostridia bacterium OttesenSCG-928-F22]
MKVILQQDLKGTGKSGEVINVSEGYARNYLLPKGLALPADAANMNEYTQKQNAAKHKKDLEKQQAQEAADKLSGSKITIAAKTGENGKLFGSITSKEISEELSKIGFAIDKRKVELKEPIRTLSTQEVVIKVYAGITAKITVEVVSL